MRTIYNEDLTGVWETEEHDHYFKGTRDNYRTNLKDISDINGNFGEKNLGKNEIYLRGTRGIMRNF